MNKDTELFKGKTFSDLAKDIYDNSKRKGKQVNLLIGELQPLIKNSGDATVIVPLIKEYLEVAVKNDDHLVKLAGIFQRMISTTERSIVTSGNSILSEEEKQQLLDEIEDVITDDIPGQTEDVIEERVEDKINKVKQQLNITDTEENE